MSAKVWTALVAGLFAGVALTVVTTEPPPATKVVTKTIYKPRPEIRYEDRPVSRMPQSCLDLIDAALRYEQAAEDFYAQTGRAADKLEEIRNHVADPKRFDVLMKEYEALEVSTFTDPQDSVRRSPAREMSDFINVQYPVLRKRCDADVKDNLS